MKFQKLFNNYLSTFNNFFLDFHIFRTILAIFGTSKFFKILSLFSFSFKSSRSPSSLIQSLCKSNFVHIVRECFSSSIPSPHNLQILYSLLFPLHLPISAFNLQHPALNYATNLLQVLSSMYAILPLPSPSLSPLFAIYINTLELNCNCVLKMLLHY